MALGIAEIVLLGLLVDWLARKIRLPGLIGLLLMGALLGPHGTDLLNEETRRVAGDLRLFALAVILLRAGFEISREALSRVGGRALLLSFIPCVCEIIVISLVAPFLLGLTRLESAILGGVLAAVSPAVVVPLMIKFISERRGEAKAVPTMVLAGASCDDAVSIVLCMSLLGLYVGRQVNWVSRIVSIPASVVFGLVAGVALGLTLIKLFDRLSPRATKRVLVLLGASVFLLEVEERVNSFIPFSALIAIMATGFIILELREKGARELSGKLGKIWVFAQLLLFTLVGAQVNVPLAARAGVAGTIVIAMGLLGRTVGVQCCLIGSNLNRRERLFVAFSYLPKATVQAAIGAVPLAAMKGAEMAEAPGEVILAVAVLSIVLTAPVGALLIAWGGKNLLAQDGTTGTHVQQALSHGG